VCVCAVRASVYAGRERATGGNSCGQMSIPASNFCAKISLCWLPLLASFPVLWNQ
jgi:hypothetical protein